MPKQSEILLELEKACKASHRVENLCRDFELQKVCYIPLNVFVLRPLHRLIHYKQILERLCKHYPATHVDFRDCRGAVLRPDRALRSSCTALADVSEVVDQFQRSLIKMENLQKLLELKKDMLGVDNLVVPGRDNQNTQFHFFILSPSSSPTLSIFGPCCPRFLVLSDVFFCIFVIFFQIRESEDEWGVPNAFTLIGQGQSVVVAASSNNLPTFPECPEDYPSEAESEDDMMASHTSLEKPTPHRGNTMVHVCWHRNTSVSMVDFSIAVEVSAKAQTCPSSSSSSPAVFFLCLRESRGKRARQRGEALWMEVIRSATVPSSQARLLNSKDPHFN
ncbi:hypothetical protein XENOCAPTIV_011069 [Xenoophorus captivus]|uniref:DH domain-containing protein n=1 Tax=Xenoophorus captivus TaxID=1517983 RepID=A0ABV0QR79_9TELE